LNDYANIKFERICLTSYKVRSDLVIDEIPYIYDSLKSQRLYMRLVTHA